MTSENIYHIAKYWLNQNHKNSAVDWVKLMADDLKIKFDNEKIIVSDGELLEMLHKSKVIISQMKRSMMSHPDHEEGSEFDDFTSSAQQIENDISELIKKVTV